MFDKEYFEGGGISNYRSYKDMMMMMKKVYFPKVLKDVKIPKGSKILDIGCAYGYFLKLCEEIDCETYGIDISEYAINMAKQELKKTKLFVHDVEKGLDMFRDNFFDLVTMFDVIEHLKSPFLVLKEIYRILKPAGKLIITTPNLNALDRFVRKVIRKENIWHGFVDKTHIYLFTPKSLAFLVERSGFKVIKVETPFHPLPKILQEVANKTGLGGQIWLVGLK